MSIPLHRSLLSVIPSTPPLLPLRHLHLRPFAFPLTTYSRKNIPTRKMSSSSAPAKKEFLCILPDKQGVLEKRLEVRGNHIEGAIQLEKEGSLALGGAMFNSHPKEGETPSFKGSALMVLAENEGEARKIVENDVYSRSGVWDLENTQIIPFKSAVRVGL